MVASVGNLVLVEPKLVVVGSGLILRRKRASDPLVLVLRWCFRPEHRVGGLVRHFPCTSASSFRCVPNCKVRNCISVNLVWYSWHSEAIGFLRQRHLACLARFFLVALSAIRIPNKPDEKQRVETAGGRVIKSTCTIDDVLPTSRALGSWLYKSYVTAEPEVKTVKREPRDEFLILATDGLWDTVTPAAACSFVQRRLRSARITMPWEPRLDSRGSPTILAKDLVRHAIRAGSQDNVSVVLILFRKFWDERRPRTTK